MNSLTASSGNISVTIPTLVVTTANDDAGTTSNCTIQTTPGTGTDASCSLRDALLFAAGQGSASITFDSTAFAAAQTISLTSGTLTIPSNTTINGPTTGTGYSLTNLVTVAGGGPGSGFPVFTQNLGGTGAIINNLIITNGNGGNGGAIVSNGGLTLNYCTISGNSASVDEGAIDNLSGTLTVTNSTISGNSTAFNGGAIASYGTTTVTNSTIAGNSAPDNAGAIFNYGILTIRGSAISNNSATQNNGGAILSYGSVTVTNSVISGNSSGSLGAGMFNVGGTLNANYNVFYNNLENGISGDDCRSCSSNTNEITTNPNLAPLGSYGGPKQTMLPLPASGAICSASSALIPSGVTADQRGFGLVSTYCPAGSVDSGAVQTNYALAFSTEPPANVIPTVTLTPNPVVQLTESDVVAATAASPVSVSGSPAALSGTVSGTLASGSASFSNIAVSAAATNETLTATLALTSSLNLTTQSSHIQVAFPAPPAFTSPAPGSVLGTNNLTFSWTPGPSVYAYDLYMGTTGPGSLNLYNSGGVSTDSITVPSVPSIGAAVYVRLSYKINGTWQNSDYTYTESPSVAPVLTSPTPGSVIGTSNVVFSWTPGAGVTAYDLYLGTTGVGSANLYNSTGVTTTSVTVPTLPSLGATVYARLYYQIKGVWQFSDYTYTEQ